MKIDQNDPKVKETLAEFAGMNQTQQVTALILGSLAAVFNPRCTLSDDSKADAAIQMLTFHRAEVAASITEFWIEEAQKAGLREVVRFLLLGVPKMHEICRREAERAKLFAELAVNSYKEGN